MLVRRTGRALGLAIAFALHGATTHAQTAPAAPPATNQLTADQRIEQLEREIEAQRQAFEAQRAQLEGRIEKIEAQAASAGAQAAEAKSQSELAAIMGPGTEDDELTAEPVVRVYGFADVGLQRSWGPIAEIIPGGTNKTTFVLGNVNLYFDANPISDWRFLTESARVGSSRHTASGTSTTGRRRASWSRRRCSSPRRSCRNASSASRLSAASKRCRGRSAITCT
jgi:hypothetical protein